MVARGLAILQSTNKVPVLRRRRKTVLPELSPAPSCTERLMGDLIWLRSDLLSSCVFHVLFRDHDRRLEHLTAGLYWAFAWESEENRGA